MTTYCLGFAFYRERRKVVLISKTKPAWQRGKLNGVGGKIEAGETCNVAMAREFKEETGCETFCTDWVKFTEMRFPDVVVYCFACRLPSHKEVRSTTEEEVLVWDLDDLPERIIPNLAWLVPMALHALDQDYEDNSIPHTLDHV
jgi:8-oxo-dGTP diphosphatase